MYDWDLFSLKDGSKDGKDGKEGKDDGCQIEGFDYSDKITE